MRINTNKLTNITDRILKSLEIEGITKYKFYKDLGLSNGFLDKSREIGTDKFFKIMEYLPKINPYWLLTGQGSIDLPDGISHNDALQMAVLGLKTKTLQDELDKPQDPAKVILEKEHEISNLTRKNLKLTKEKVSLTNELTDLKSKLKTSHEELLDVENELKECRSDKDMYKRIIDKTL